MLGTLSENLTSYGSLTRSNVSSLIRDMKLDKIQFNSLISKMSSYSSGSQFLTQKVGAGIELNREILVEMFRDSSLRVAKFFSGANAVGLALNSMIDVLSSEIDKVENDLNSLQIFIDNYEYLSGKDDLYNNNYIEKFDTLQNHYKYDGHNFLIKDKDGTNFPIEGNLLIDYTKGLIGINNSFTVKNIINNIMSVRIHSNYESNISSQTSFNNVFTENKQDAWTTTVKSKSILSSTLPLYDQYILYSQVGINGARAAVEIMFSSVVSANQIRINPNFTKGMQLLQVIIFSPSEQNTNSNNSSQNYILALNAPKSLDVTTDIFFERKNINKVIFIFNQ